MLDIQTVQQNLKEQQIDAWFFFEIYHRNTAMDTLLNIHSTVTQSRRCGYLIPKNGLPIKIVHKIEAEILDHLPGEKRCFASWKEFETVLEDALKPYSTIAMEYSPKMGIPAVSLVDAGIVELLTSFGKTIVSSADLLQTFEAVWNEKQYTSHKRAVESLHACVEQTFSSVRQRLDRQEIFTEYDIQQEMIHFLESRGMIMDHPPIVAVSGGAASPHYEPNKNQSSLIKEGDFLLIDLWCKEKEEGSVYGDITWTAGIGKNDFTEHKKVFEIVRDARHAALHFIQERFAQKITVFGYEVDDACRKVIEKAGYGPYFIHRTGHSIGVEVHGRGANIDNFETHDARELLPGTCFSLEPGIYLPGKFGVRSEIDVFIHPDGHVECTSSKTQEEFIVI